MNKKYIRKFHKWIIGNNTALIDRESGEVIRNIGNYFCVDFYDSQEPMIRVNSDNSVNFNSDVIFMDQNTSNWLNNQPLRGAIL